MRKRLDPEGVKQLISLQNQENFLTSILYCLRQGRNGGTQQVFQELGRAGQLPPTKKITAYRYIILAPGVDPDPVGSKFARAAQLDHQRIATDYASWSKTEQGARLYLQANAPPGSYVFLIVGEIQGVDLLAWLNEVLNNFKNELQLAQTKKLLNSQAETEAYEFLERACEIYANYEQQEEIISVEVLNFQVMPGEEI